MSVTLTIDGKSMDQPVKEGTIVLICGEHGGGYASIHFCQSIGLDYVSCSQCRVPIASIVTRRRRSATRPRAKPD
jgi:pyruvate,orthophosphate dikinase